MAEEACNLEEGQQQAEQEANEKEPGIEYHGPVKERHCTDVICCILFIAHFVFLFIIIFALGGDGSLQKLYKPRDYQGAYCGIKEQWNSGPDLESYPKLSYTMNVSKTVDVIAKQLMCSSAAHTDLQGLLSASELSTYRCECCLSQCYQCKGSLDLGGDLTSSNLGSIISGRLTGLNGIDASAVGDLYNPTAANGDYFADLWGEASSHLNEVCLSSCDENYESFHSSRGNSTGRNYTYKPAPDDPLRIAWEALLSGGSSTIRDTIADQFTFVAYPESVCPYDAQFCVPFPGIDFTEQYESNYCSFGMTTAVIDTVGSQASQTFETLGGDALAENAKETVSLWVGEFEQSMDAHVIVGVLALVIGIIYLVLLRFFLRMCTWIAIFLVLTLFALGGGMSYVRSFQCADVGFWETGKQTAVAVTVAGTTALTNAVTGEVVSEAMDENGDGSDYRGAQAYSRNGYSCQKWTSQSPHGHIFTPENYPDKGLGDFAYCRNPYNESDLNKGRTIWCFTTDTEKKWDLCSPIGVIAPECVDGYAVSGEAYRKALEILAYIIWAIGGVWLLLIICFSHKISDAVSINQTAAMFVYGRPTIILVPIVQALTTLIWTFCWCFMVAFIVSQVPDSYTPSGDEGWYATYAEAYGTSDTPGKCTDKWPTGLVWKDETCTVQSGVTKCWRCAPPRIIIDWRFAYPLYSYLWVNAFTSACQICIIAGAVCAWFFTPNKDKGKKASIRTSVWNVVRYHGGSLAFGAAILALVQFIRWLLYYFQKQAEAQKNYVMALILKVLQCCVWMIEKCVKFLNKNAYIQIAMQGTNFCRSAYNAAMMIFNNMIRFSLVLMIGGAVVTIGWICIMIGTTVVGYLIVRALHPDLSLMIPVCFYVLLGYIVGKLYMSVFSLAIDTCLQCLIVSEEKGLGGEFVPGPLANRLPKTNKKVDGEGNG